jgi:hypothetical protein
MEKQLEAFYHGLSQKVRIAISVLTYPSSESTFVTVGEISDYLSNSFGLAIISDSSKSLIESRIQAAVRTLCDNKVAFRTSVRIQSQSFKRKGLQYGYTLNPLVLQSVSKASIKDSEGKEALNREEKESNVSLRAKLEAAYTKLQIQASLLEEANANTLKAYAERDKAKSELLPKVEYLLKENARLVRLCEHLASR